MTMARTLLLLSVVALVAAACGLQEQADTPTPAPMNEATAVPSQSPKATPTSKPKDPSEPSEGGPSDATITVKGVEVTVAHTVVRGETTLPDGACVNTELWADGVLQSWWPSDRCAAVTQGTWELEVPLEADQRLESGVQYMVRAYQPGGPDVASTFPFDLSGPATPPSAPPAEDPTLVLPESAEPLHWATADLDGDGAAEEIVLTGWGGGDGGLGFDFLQLFVITSIGGGDYGVAWQSEQLPTERGEALEVRDVNGDGSLEVLSVQAMGASGETLYVLGRRAGDYGWLRPEGGHFDRQDAFGEAGASVEDRDGDGLEEIVAWYGPAASRADVYAWDGQAYAYQETLGGLEVSYQRTKVAEAGLSLELPAGWTEINDATWAAPEDDTLRLGVQWADLEPPQEPEAVLLPQPGQILESVPLELPWSSARRFVIEVYGEAGAGAEQAPVTSVEAHVLAIIETGGERTAVDVYAAAPSAQELTILAAILQRATKTVVLE
jgi:hypothetical protein